MNNTNKANTPNGVLDIQFLKSEHSPFESITTPALFKF